MAGRICKAVIARFYVLLTIEALISSHRFLYLTNSDDLYRPIISYLAGCKMHRNAFSKLPSGGFPDIIDVMKAERVSGKDAYTVIGLVHSMLSLPIECFEQTSCPKLARCCRYYY